MQRTSPHTAPTPTILAGQFSNPEAAAALHERNRRIAAENDHAVFGERLRRTAELRREYDRGHDEGYNQCLHERHTSGFDWGFLCGGTCAALGAALVITYREPLQRLLQSTFGA